MKTEEVGALVALATANFPNMQEKDMGPTVALWSEILSDIPFDLAKAALIKVLVTAKFWPTVAEIREAATQLANPQALLPAEAWGLVTQANSKYGYYRASEGMESLPTMVQEVVRALGGFRTICMSENPDITRAHFLKMYEQYANREREYNLLPTGVRQLVDRTAKALTGASEKETMNIMR